MGKYVIYMKIESF